MTLTDNYNNDIVIIISIDPSNNRYSSTRVLDYIMNTSTRVLEYSIIDSTICTPALEYSGTRLLKH